MDGKLSINYLGLYHNLIEKYNLDNKPIIEKNVANEFIRVLSEYLPDEANENYIFPIDISHRMGISITKTKTLINIANISSILIHYSLPICNDEILYQQAIRGYLTDYKDVKFLNLNDFEYESLSNIEMISAYKISKMAVNIIYDK